MRKRLLGRFQSFIILSRFGTDDGNVNVVRLVVRGSTTKLQDDLLRDCPPQKNFPQVF